MVSAAARRCACITPFYLILHQSLPCYRTNCSAYVYHLTFIMYSIQHLLCIAFIQLISMVAQYDVHIITLTDHMHDHFIDHFQLVGQHAMNKHQARHLNSVFEPWILNPVHYTIETDSLKREIRLVVLVGFLFLLKGQVFKINEVKC